MDGLRFFSYTYTGTGAAVNWSAIQWIKPEGQTATAPSTDKTAYAQVANAMVNVAANDNVKLAGLSLEDGATLNVPSGAEAFLDVLYVEGQAVQAGRYTGTGSVGTQVSWISGAGVVHVGDDGFLQATGNQAINPGYFVKPSTRIVVDYAFTSATPTQQRVFGAASDDASAGLSCAHYINGGGSYAWAFQDGKGNWVLAFLDTSYAVLNSRTGTVPLANGFTVAMTGEGIVYSKNINGVPIKVTYNLANCVARVDAANLVVLYRNGSLLSSIITYNGPTYTIESYNDSGTILKNETRNTQTNALICMDDYVRTPGMIIRTFYDALGNPAAVLPYYGDTKPANY